MKLNILTLLLFLYSISNAQQIEEDQLGSWYMGFVNAKFENSNFGVQGDYQLRQWNIAGDLEQLLLRTGATYSPKHSEALFTFGYASITSGTFGDEFDSTSHENRIYQEALLPQKVGKRVMLTHRFRYEQRFVENQDFRTRYRYNLFANIPVNQTDLSKGATYVALYNELFVNGEREIGQSRTVELFDRNRTYVGMGKTIGENTRIQLGYMNQLTDQWEKGQLQFSLHQALNF